MALGLADVLRRRGCEAALIAEHISDAPVSTVALASHASNLKHRSAAGGSHTVPEAASRPGCPAPQGAAALAGTVIRIRDAGAVSPEDVGPRLLDGRILLVAPADAPGLMRTYAWLKTAHKAGALERTAVVFNGVSEEMTLAEAAARVQTATRRFLAVEIPVWAGLPLVTEEAALQALPGLGRLQGGHDVPLATEWAEGSAAEQWIRGLNDVVDRLLEVWIGRGANNVAVHGEDSHDRLLPPHAGAA
ncbi:hypothetical protein JCM17478_05280 [Thermopirellula anaerolimosa]